MRAWILGAVGAVLASVSSVVTAQDETTIDNWVLRSNEQVCWIQTYYDNAPDGLSRSLSVQMDYDTSWIGMSRADWNFADQEISAEIWLTRDVDREPDHVYSGTVENKVVFVDGGDHFTDDLGERDYVAIRIKSLDIFEGYELGKTKSAVASLYDCSDYLW